MVYMLTPNIHASAVQSKGKTNASETWESKLIHMLSI